LPVQQAAGGPPIGDKEVDGSVEKQHRDGVVEQPEDVDGVDAV